MEIKKNRKDFMGLRLVGFSPQFVVGEADYRAKLYFSAILFCYFQQIYAQGFPGLLWQNQLRIILC